jgi:hypothetical protein
MALPPKADSQRDSNEEAPPYFTAAPGTEILFDDSNQHGAFSEQLHRLQHRSKGDSRILLVPQPSLTDPNDPLKWPAWKKYLTFFNACWYAFMGSITGPIMAAGK